MMRDFIKVMKALSDPSRVKILKMLQHRDMCVCEIQAALGLAQPTISKHLKVLEEAGLVGFVKDGLWVNYFLAEGTSSPFAATLLGNLRHWMDDEPSVHDIVERLSEFEREKICEKGVERQKRKRKRPRNRI